MSLSAHLTETNDQMTLICGPVLAPVLPLAVLRIEQARVVVALALVGRFREAWSRSGGVVAMLVAAGLIWMRNWPSAVGDGNKAFWLLAAIGLVAITTWATRERTPTRIAGPTA